MMELTQPRSFFLLAVVAAACLSIASPVAGRRPPRGGGSDDVSRQTLAAQSKETTPVDFVRLVVMRLIFGLASALGYGETLSGFLGGVFVPPGADYDDEYDFVPDLF